MDLHEAGRPWDYVSLSDDQVIKGLLMFRDKLDIYYCFSLKDCRTHDARDINESLICLYADLDELIRSCRFDQIQLWIITWISCGYRFNEIGAQLGTEGRIISTLFTQMCKRIARQHEYQWRLWCNERFQIHGWKLCGKCGERLPGNLSFFGKDSRNRDGLYSWCRRCHSSSKKTLHTKC